MGDDQPMICNNGFINDFLSNIQADQYPIYFTVRIPYQKARVVVRFLKGEGGFGFEVLANIFYQHVDFIYCTMISLMGFL